MDEQEENNQEEKEEQKREEQQRQKEKEEQEQQRQKEEDQQEEKTEEKTEEIKLPKEKLNFSKSYDKHYKKLFFIPIILLVLSLFYLASFYTQNGDIIYKDITLTGGTSIQVNTNTDIEILRQELETNFQDVSIRSISNILTGEQVAILIETSAPPEEIKPFLETYFGFELTSENSSIEFTGSKIGGSFYNQLRFAIALSFIFMAIVVFIIFRSYIPSLAVIFSAFSDIVLTVTVVNLLGMRLSTAGIMAFLMLIGYSVDTDILLTTRILKRRGFSINSRLFNAFKTGITMTLTSLAVVLVGLFLTASFSKVFSQIFTILTIGLLFNILFT